MQALPANVAYSPDVIFEEVSGEIMLMHLGSEEYFSLDAVGRRVWELLGEHGSFQALLDALLCEYEVDEARLRGDLERLLRGLLAAGLLVPATEPGVVVSGR